MHKLGFGAAVLALAAFAAPAQAADGKTVYNKSCAGCHKMMAPKLGDKEAFAPLQKRGLNDVAAAVVKGKGAMPPLGGAANEADAKAATEYMMSQSK